MLKEDLDKNNIPQHVAVIMDGNGRWAEKHGKQRLEGHAQGAKAARLAVETAHELGIRYITLYAFSMENWRRPESEVSGLMSLLTSSIAHQFTDLIENNVRLLTIGDNSFLPQNVRGDIENVVKKSASNTGLTVIIALSYSGRYEIVEAAKKLLYKYRENPFDISKIDEKTFAENLYTAQIPDPELLIRTSGEFRISNFLLWQISYSELYFSRKFWPDFSREDFIDAVYDYQHRERRFGKTSLQINECK
jgi:undecaprenyl diphosphate synthase